MGATVDHYTSGSLQDIVVAALDRAGLGSGTLSVEDLGPLDEFHTAGRPATIALADAAGLHTGMRVLDVGAGIGGPARVLSSSYGCSMTALDLTPEFCSLAEYLNERTGLADRIRVVVGDATALPFEGGSFDAVWTQHVQMNIDDKPHFYAELRRMLEPGGTLAFWDIVAGDGSPIEFPVPWASEPSISFLASFDELREIVQAAGFDERLADDRTEEARAFFSTVMARMGTEEQPPLLGLHLLIKDARTKFVNMNENVASGKLRFLRGVYTAV